MVHQVHEFAERQLAVEQHANFQHARNSWYLQCVQLVEAQAELIGSRVSTEGLRLLRTVRLLLENGCDMQANAAVFFHLLEALFEHVSATTFLGSLELQRIMYHVQVRAGVTPAQYRAWLVAQSADVPPGLQTTQASLDQLSMARPDQPSTPRGQRKGSTHATFSAHATARKRSSLALFGAVAQGVVGQIGVDGGARPSLSQLSSQLSPRRRGTGLNVGGLAGHGDAPTGAAVGQAAFTPRRPQQPAGE